MTARRVAAQRRHFEREAAPFGRPEDDDRLHEDVANGLDVSETFMTGYLRARTRFFDRLVVRWIEAGGRQVVSVGAGYDGRSLRYAKPGVRWFELDLADTQADKRARLGRLGIVSHDVAYVPADFSTDDAGHALAAARHDPTLASLFTCEGVGGYLPPQVFRRLLESLADVAGPNSRLGITIALEARTEDARQRRRALADAVGGMGEPLQSAIAAADLVPTLAACGWAVTKAMDPAGHPVAESEASTVFVVASPGTAAPTEASPTTSPT